MRNALSLSLFLRLFTWLDKKRDGVPAEKAAVNERGVWTVEHISVDLSLVTLDVMFHSPATLSKWDVVPADRVEGGGNIQNGQDRDHLSGVARVTRLLARFHKELQARSFLILTR